MIRFLLLVVRGPPFLTLEAPLSRRQRASLSSGRALVYFHVMCDLLLFLGASADPDFDPGFEYTPNHPPSCEVGGVIWRIGARTFFGWPDMEDREERVLVRIFAHTKNRFWGLFAREGAADHVDGDNAPLVWIELEPGWSPLLCLLINHYVLKQ